MMNRHHQDENETHSYREKEMEFQCLCMCNQVLANHNDRECAIDFCVLSFEK